MRYRLVLVLFVLSFFSPSASAFVVGQKKLEYFDSHRNRTPVTTIWYPARDGSKTVVVDSSPVFIPLAVAVDAPLSTTSETYPLVMISHGSGGEAKRLFWLAGYLASRGYIAVGVDHPGNKFKNNSPEGLWKVWERPQDISFVLTKVLASHDWKNHIDPKRISAVGHSAGGTTVLLLAGGRLSYARLTNPVPYCSDRDPVFAPYCRALAQISPRTFAKSEVEKNYRDPRISAIVSLDPGFAKSFKPESLVHLEPRVLALLADHLKYPEDEIYAKEFLELLPKGSAQLIPGSVHFSFLTACQSNVNENDPELAVICGENAQKLKVQDSVRELTLEFLNR